MDIPRLVATYLSDMTGFKAEADPSPAKIKDGHIIVSVDSFWKEPYGTWDSFFEQTQNGEKFSFKENGKTVEFGVEMALPIKVVYHSRGAGEQWRGQTIADTQKIVKRLQEPFRIPIVGGKVTGKAAEMMANHVPDFDEVNTDSTHGLGYIVYLERDPNNDKAFEPVTAPDGKINGYIAEQAFKGEVFFIDAVKEV